MQKKLTEFYNSLIKTANYLLNNYPVAHNCLEYLNSRVNKDIQDKFTFGYFPKIKDISILYDYFDFNQLNQNKMLFEREIGDSLFPRKATFSFFDNYELIIPFKDAYGEIIALIGRTLLSEGERKEINIPKYKNTIFKKRNHLFGLFENKREIIKTNFVYVVEGQFDVIKANEHGINNIVALSNSSMSQYQLSLLLRYTDNIFLLLDNDQAGEKGRKIIMERYNRFANIKNIYLPSPYKDIDEYLKHNSSIDFNNLRS